MSNIHCRKEKKAAVKAEVVGAACRLDTGSMCWTWPHPEDVEVGQDDLYPVTINSLNLAVQCIDLILRFDLSLIDALRPFGLLLFSSAERHIASRRRTFRQRRDEIRDAGRNQKHSHDTEPKYYAPEQTSSSNAKTRRLLRQNWWG